MIVIRAATIGLLSIASLTVMQHIEVQQGVPSAALAVSARAYQPFGAAETVFYARDPEVIVSGPAGTGKSRSCLEKLHLLATKYPGSRHLIARKSRESLSESGLVTYELKVLPEGSPICAGVQRRFRAKYRYPNGSEIVIGGMDKPEKVLSTEFDTIYCQEATEITENDWETLITRLRNNRMPYQQIFGDCNPSSPQHWIKRRADQGTLRMIESRHEDNPELWNRATREWTEFGVSYIGRLDRLTGVRRLRLRHGIWAMAEGMVYGDVWDPAIHIVDRFEIPEEWPRYWVVDFGFTNPFCWQAWAEDNDGRLYRYREIYRTNRLVEDHAADILKATEGEPRPAAIICDHDAEDRATLERHLGMGTWPAWKGITDGVQAVAERLRPAGDGRPRIFFLRDSLVERDELLAESKRPQCTDEEWESYVWDGLKEKPVAQNNHGMDCIRYLVAYRDLQYSAGVYV